MTQGTDVLMLVVSVVLPFVVGFALGHVAMRKYKSLYGFNAGLMRVYERTFSQLQERTRERNRLAARLREIELGATDTMDRELAEMESKRTSPEREGDE